jgi:N-methylhydantoinase B
LCRDPGLVANDVANGLVSLELARTDYGVVLTDDGRVDETATAKRRAIR